MNKKPLIHTGKIILGCLTIVALIGFVEKKHLTKSSLDLEISIVNQNGNFFITQEDIVELITEGPNSVLGQNVNEKELHEIETRLVAHKFIDGAQVYKNLKGKLVAEVQQSTPIARLLRPDDPDAYVTKEGNILPTSEKYAARVPLLSGDYTQRMIEDGRKVPQEAAEIMELLRFISGSDFWRAQVAQLDIDQRGEIIIYPQVGKQYIEFGTTSEFASKFERLEIFYKKILPKEGWNKYSRVNVKYRDQIICE